MQYTPVRVAFKTSSQTPKMQLSSKIFNGFHKALSWCLTGFWIYLCLSLILWAIFAQNLIQRKVLVFQQVGLIQKNY